MLNRRYFILGGLAVAACATHDGGLALAPNTRLILFRHADRDGDELNDLGIARSQALVAALRDTPIDAVYSASVKRNIDTATPLANDRGLEIEFAATTDPTRELVRRGAGRTLVWIGNKGNLNAIWENLQLDGPAPVEYGDLFTVVSDGDGRISVIRQRVEVSL